ncbi:MAG TPA: flagellar biosynthesis anti-sigma factor FlgM [Candidatus Deferrimicrobiaceae bacterium]
MASGRSKGTKGTIVPFGKTGGVAPVSASSGSSGQGGVGRTTEPGGAISDFGRVVAEAARLLDSVPDIRIEKVESIQTAMDAGTYHVEGNKVAERIVSEAVREIRNRNRKP